MKLVVAAPVCHRAWALPTWYRCLAAQTRPPDEILLVHGGARNDATWEAIDDMTAETGIATHRLHQDEDCHQRHDNERFKTLSRLRNHMLAGCRVFCDADLVLSLDTDIMLEDEETIQRLLFAVGADAPPGDGVHDDTPAMQACVRGELATFDVASCLTHFHPDMQWTRNAGYLGNPSHHPQEALDAGKPEDLRTWPWRRAEIEPKYADRGIQPIDIPMGIVMMTRKVWREHQVGYMWHESGEDIGYGINLRLAGMTAGWIPSLQARHVWSPDKL